MRRRLHPDDCTRGRFTPKSLALHALVWLACCYAALVAAPVCAQMPWVAVADSGDGFVLEGSDQVFEPWGFNYDHDDQGRLIEDYWAGEWPTIAEDFREMRSLGANVVRVHLQVGKFLAAPNTANDDALDRLQRLLKLAEETGLYLDITGLGCYHKKDVPAWYDALSEQDRWRAQAHFWEAVAQRCAASPAVFCYDLMNEPVVPGGTQNDWLGKAFAGKHFVQFISRDRRDRPRPQIARQWIGQLTAAIRKHDQRHMITVGLVPWSLDRPGLTSGFVPGEIAGELDFVSVHIYPEKDKVPEALETLKGFSVGKPVVIEEMFPLKCSLEELSRFVDVSRDTACGWIGFYWGKTPEEYRQGDRFVDAIMLAWLEWFESRVPVPQRGR